jgi:hypothetical protein
MPLLETDNFAYQFYSPCLSQNPSSPGIVAERERRERMRRGRDMKGRVDKSWGMETLIPRLKSNQQKPSFPG